MKKTIGLPRIVKMSLIVLAIMQFILQAGLLTQGVEFITSSLTIDDTYYYLQTAWNTKQFGFVTFDGIHSTNGVQLLWFGIVTLLAFLTPNKIAFLYVALIICFLFNALCYSYIWKIAKLLKQPLLALFMASLWCSQILSFRIYSTGMENSLHALVFWCVVWQVIVFFERVYAQAPPNFLGVTVTLILNAWTRLDAGLFSAILYLFCVSTLIYREKKLRTVIQKHGKPLTFSIILAILGFLGQLYCFWIMGGSLLPVSALIKSLGLSLAWTPHLLNKFRESIQFSFPHEIPYKMLFSRFEFYLIGICGLLLSIGLRLKTTNNDSFQRQALFQMLWNGLLITFFLYHLLIGYGLFFSSIGFIVCVSVTFFHIQKEHNDFPKVRLLQLLWYALIVAFILYHIIIIILRTYYPHDFAWYRSPLYIYWIITFALFSDLFKRIMNRILVRKNWFANGFIIVCSIILIGKTFHRFTEVFTPIPLYKERYHAALWLAEHLPPNTMCAAWNAGQLGYFSEQTVINLDGLVNSITYYHEVQQGKRPLFDYLKENNVHYIIDYCCVDEAHLTPYLRLVHSFVIPSEDSYPLRLWRLTTEYSQK